jgi:predicted RNA-binding protein with PIN domain
LVLTGPQDQIGRAVSDLKSMSASFDAPQDSGNGFRVTGRGPVSEMSHYQTELQSYTKGRGRISCSFAGYYPCHNTAKVVEETGYEADRDVENTADSVFCSHGAGVNVKWDKADGFMHVDSGLSFSGGTVSEAAAPKVRSRSTDFDEKELEAIMLREFGPIKRPQYSAVTYDYNKDKGKTAEIKKEYYIVDGYNVIFAWDELKRLAKDSIDSARDRLISTLSSFAGYRGCELVLVFDGYKVKGNPGTREEDQGIRVAYTRENETADQYIEKLVHDIGKNYSVKVATSDGLIQLAALRLGVIRMSSRELKSEVDRTLAEIREILDRQGYYRNTLGDVIKDI